MSTPTAPTGPLDDVMLAMDVADTVRHRQDLAARDASADRAALIESLRDIYRDQGIAVPDHILEAGLDALDESRFAYAPPRPSLETLLANLYVTRSAWGRGVLAFVIVVGLGFGGYYFGYRPYVAAQREAARIELAVTLPAQMDALYSTIYEETKVQQAANEAEELVREGKAAATAGNRDGAMAALGRLTEIRDTLRLHYAIGIVDRPDVKPGFWTFPERNNAATNYYIVVEALDSDGKALSLPIRNEETGTTETVKMWALRVPEGVYAQIAADKQDDGIIQQSRVGQKEDGFLDTDYYIPVLGGALTRW